MRVPSIKFTGVNWQALQPVGQPSFPANSIQAPQPLIADTFSRCQTRFGASAQPSGGQGDGPNDPNQRFYNNAIPDVPQYWDIPGWNPRQGTQGIFYTDPNPTNYAVPEQGNEATDASEPAAQPQADPYAGWSREDRIEEGKRLMDLNFTQKAAAKAVHLNSNELVGYESKSGNARSQSNRKRHARKRNPETDPYAGWSPEARKEEGKRLIDLGFPKMDVAKAVHLRSSTFYGYKSKGVNARSEATKRQWAKQKAAQTASEPEGYSSTGLTDVLSRLKVSKQSQSNPKRFSDAFKHFQQTGELDSALSPNKHAELIGEMTLQAKRVTDPKKQKRALDWIDRYATAYDAAFTTATHRKALGKSMTDSTVIASGSRPAQPIVRSMTPEGQWSNDLYHYDNRRLARDFAVSNDPLEREACLHDPGTNDHGTILGRFFSYNHRDPNNPQN